MLKKKTNQTPNTIKEAKRQTHITDKRSISSNIKSFYKRKEINSKKRKEQAQSRKENRFFFKHMKMVPHS